MQHSAIVKIHEAFTTKDFGDHSLVFVYDYFPNSKTLEEQFTLNNNSNNSNNNNTNNKQTPTSNSNNFVDENLIWSFIIQLTSALKTVHASGLACRNIHPSKIIVTSTNRLRISQCGILDVLTHEQQDQNIAMFQQGK